MKNTDQDQWIIFPEALWQGDLGARPFANLPQYTVGYLLDIAQMTRLRQPYRLDCPDYLHGVSTSRLNAFFAGRIGLEAILRQHFCCHSAVTSKSIRLPIWPQGLAGSISHTQDQVFVIVSEKHQYVGADLQGLIGLDTAQQIASLILSPSEQRLGQGCVQYGLDFSQFLSLVFSMKESLYKAVYPFVQRYIDFLEVELIDLDLTQHLARFEFCSSMTKDHPALKYTQAQWQWCNGHVISYVLG